MTINKNNLEAGTELATYRTTIKMARRFNNDIAEVQIVNPDTGELLGSQHVVAHYFEPHRDLAHKAVVRWLESCGIEVLNPDTGDTDAWFGPDEHVTRTSVYDPGTWLKWDVFVVQVTDRRALYGITDQDNDLDEHGNALGNKYRRL